MMKNYEKVPWGKDHFAISFISGPYYGIMYYYTSVKFIPDGDDNLILKFGYEIIVGKEDIPSIPEFEQCVGDNLLELIEEGVQKNEIVYAGGI